MLHSLIRVLAATLIMGAAVYGVSSFGARSGWGASARRPIIRPFLTPMGLLTASTITVDGLMGSSLLEAVLTVVEEIVRQDVQLFHATVRDNLTFFNPGIPDERIQRALDELGLGEWVVSLPEGLDTELASGGEGLSAGTPTGSR